ncbi:MAG: AAA family ATPase [Candidatus Omnitrophica bacterium]|nr:AAA family ATPase [Candidatus Omnitrophota bacterium]
MYLKELEIFGFKSFPEKTKLLFEPGTTVVVGPNGCGKSNVFDAIKWSLGEQSPKSLRGAKMEDVIFNGTERHPALSYSEVTLVFSNEDNYLPIDYKEVSVARRLYRSGESQYFINKSLVRLKDVQQLFMGTGIGESTYSFVEQGKIAIFLSHKPEEKRLIFDEASGIVKYKDRKKETLKRLKEADDNLIRLEDILSEVARQIRYLERQVQKAKKFKEVRERLIEVEKKIATIELSNLDKKSDGFGQELDAFAQQETIKTQELESLNAGANSLEEELNSLRMKLEEANGVVISVNAQIESATSHISVYVQQIDELGQRNQNLHHTQGGLKERLSLHEQRVVEEQARCLAIDGESSLADSQIVALGDESDALSKDIEQARRNAHNEKSKIFEFENDKTHAHNTLIEIQANISSFIKRKQRLTLDKTKIEELVDEKEEAFKQACSDLSNLEEELSILREKKNNLLFKEKELSSRKEEFKNKLINKEKEEVELQSYYDFLKDLSSKYDIFPVDKRITVIFDEEPKNINKLVASLKGVDFSNEEGIYKASVQAKVISLDESQLEHKIQNAAKEIEDIRINLETIGVELNKLRQELIIETKQLENQERKLFESQQEKDNLQRDCQRFREEFELVDQEQRATLESISDLEAQQSKKEEELMTHQQNLALTQGSLDAAQSTIAKSLERIKEIDIEVARKEAHKQSLFKERDSLHSKVSLFEEEKLNIFNNLASLDKEHQDNVLRSNDLQAEINTLHEKIAIDKETTKSAIQEKESLDTQERELLQKISQSRDFARSLEEQCQKFRSCVYNKKLEAQGLDYEREKIKDYLLQVYEENLQHYQYQDTGESFDELLEEKDKLIKRKHSLGEVNLVAIEEFEELKNRQDFLTQQRDDLNISKDNLKKAISKINRTCKELFLETFYKIQEEFKKNFRFLFNGGHASLMLIDKDDVLESGVEIEVQPPGKKCQNVSLLSGGEKALTAIALIFAIFRVRPSPLCVLDEIDAPLDEANVDRFNHLIKEFSSFSQFIIITHNKKTMSNADVLYGVTMQEKGVSKLVSVKLAEQEVAA